jgi:peptide deformylase
MAILDIIQMPDPRLKKPSRKVTHVDDTMKKLIDDMVETMTKYDGVGLAAVQVGVPKRLIIIRLPEIVEERLETEKAEATLEGDDEEAKRGIIRITVEKADEPESEPVVTYIRRMIVWSEPSVYINPRVVEKEGQVIDDEGCLSDMGYHAKVERARRVVVAGQDIDMNPIKQEATGLEARCLQHEIDHLDGIIYWDRMMENTRRKMDGTDAEEEEELSEQDQPKAEEVATEK